ncbi:MULTISPECIES: MobF family relaxase [Brevibacterium]|uniref:AAA domain-containing protein n=2 Tax=Brevibacterium TaxID=1696 RepID=A0A2H1KQB9_BRELN|nr:MULTISPECIES: MobF family relaxase [Brevibacterium]SMX92531.1 AAA domain-containing protein [Brevibacterium antiquum]SMY01442.1 AAA domain-containing protein [Brevibacterium linens ATCC 9172]
MKGGVTLFRGPGTAARRYLESDRSTADDYYLEGGTALADFTITNAAGEVVANTGLDPEQYAGWVDWTHPLTGERMGTPREAGEVRKGSPRFAEMVVNTPKNLSIAAALHPEVSDALDAAQQDAVAEIRRWLAQHAYTRVGPRGQQEIIPAESVQTVAVVHRTSRAGDPHRHVHFQIGTRVPAAGKWRALDTAVLFKQQGAIRALGAAVIAANPQLAATLDRHGLTLDPVTGEVTELEAFNPVMSKRAHQVERNLKRLEAEWEAAHPGEEPGPVVRARLLHKAWAHERPNKKPSDLGDEEAWRQELVEAGYDPETLTRAPAPERVSVDDLRVQEVASRALDRAAAGGSTWTVSTLREHVTRITTDHGVQATGEELREFVQLATDLAIGDCFSVLPPGAVQPEHVAHLTSLRVVEAETQLRDRLEVQAPNREPRRPDLSTLAAEHGLDAGQSEAAAAVASRDPLVVVEGAAGSGKTTMLATAIEALDHDGRAARVVTPTKKAAQVAGETLKVPADSVAALVYAHGFRWNDDGVWTRLKPGDTDPTTGQTYMGPPQGARLVRGERVIVDEAGMLDQDTALALLTIVRESRASVALVGDRAQLPAVGRGGVLDMAAHIRGATVDMSELHRFDDEHYAALTLRMRDGKNPAAIFDQLHSLGLVRLHADDDALREHIAEHTPPEDAVTVATNDEATALNERIRTVRVEAGEVDDTRTVTGSDGLAIGVGDLVQARQNDAELRVANRQTFTIQSVDEDGAVHAIETGTDRKHSVTVALPAEYVAEHVHLAYAATAYGVQGATVDSAHTVLSDAHDAAAVYVGLTRGSARNELHVVAADLADAKAQFIEAMGRDHADRGLDDATTRAHEAIAGLVKDGPVSMVSEELARLDGLAQKAEQRAAWWEQVGDQFAVLSARHREETDESTGALATAEEHAATVRAETLAPLEARAEAEGREYLDAVGEEAQAAGRLATAGWFGKRRAQREHDTAREHAQARRGRLSAEWGTLPRHPGELHAWAGRVASQQTEEAPEVVEADATVVEARQARTGLQERQRRDRLTLLASLHGADNVRRDPDRYLRTSPRRQAAMWTASAEEARTDAAELRGLPPDQAVYLIEVKRGAAETRETALRERQRQLSDDRDPARSTPRRDGPARGL